MDYEKIKENSLEQGESFAKLLEKNGSKFGRLVPGQKVKSRVVSISGDFVYIDIGGKSEGVIDLMIEYIEKNSAGDKSNFKKVVDEYRATLKKKK